MDTKENSVRQVRLHSTSIIQLIKYRDKIGFILHFKGTCAFSSMNTTMSRICTVLVYMLDYNFYKTKRMDTL